MVGPSGELVGMVSMAVQAMPGSLLFPFPILKRGNDTIPVLNLTDPVPVIEGLWQLNQGHRLPNNHVTP
jgi:hypothetical protein